MFENVEEGFTEGEKPVHYYYNREERIARAPDVVKKYYNGEMKPVKGFKVLFQGPNKFILFGLVFFVLTTWVYTGFNQTRSYSKIDGIDCELSSYSFEEQIYTSISFKWNPKTKNEDKKFSKIKAEIFLVDADKQIVYKEIRDTVFEDGTEYIRLKTSDYDIVRVDIILTVNNTERELSTNVKR